MLCNFWPFNLNKAGTSFISCSNGEKPVRLAHAYFFKLRSLSWTLLDGRRLCLEMGNDEGCGIVRGCHLTMSMFCR